MIDRIKESDWKKFRDVHQAALDRYCTRVLSEIKYVATDRETTSHERYLKIYKLIHERNETIAILFDNKSRSKALFMLAGLRGHDLVTDEEFASFSPGLRDTVAQILQLG
jgi:hypothetical protein